MTPATLPTTNAPAALSPELRPERALLEARQQAARAALLIVAAAVSGCTTPGAAVGLSKGESNGNAASEVPMPPADGPKLVALRVGTPILSRPEAGARKVGELNPGAVVARSSEPYGRKGCRDGWYAVRPRGFVCVGDGASLQTELSDVLPSPPDRSRPLPYRYGRAKTQGAPAYRSLPDRKQIEDAEPDLTRHLARAQQHDAPLGAAANDVPLDGRGVALGPPVVLPSGEGVDAGGRRSDASFFVFPEPDAIAPLVPLIALGIDVQPRDGASINLRDALKTVPLRRGSGVAIARTFSSAEHRGRRFGVTPDGALIPTDRLQPALGSTWHGLDLDKVGLPVAFVHKFDVHTWAIGRGKATRNEEELERHAALPLTGRFRTIDGTRFEETRDGAWLRAQDLIVIVRRTKFPEFAKGSQRWLDVSIANQTLTAYEGQRPIYATLISSGRDQLGDPATSASTVRGAFRIRSKHVTRAVDPRELGGSFDAADAPWVMEFEPGYALAGMYWSGSVGEAHGFHDIAITPIDARRIFMWAEPEVPEGWQAVYSQDDEGTFVNVRP